MYRFAALAVALAASLPVPSAAAAPLTTVVDLGATRAYDRSDPAAALAGIELFVRAGLDRQTAAQNGLAALVAESVLQAPVDGVPLGDAVAARGGSLTYAVSTQYVRFYLEAQPQTLAVLAPLVARALAVAAPSAEVLSAARAALDDRIADAEGDPRLVGLAMLRASYYRDGAGMPALGTPASLAALDVDAVRAFHDRWYVRGNAFVAAAGQTGDPTDAASRALVDGLPAGSAAAAVVATRSLTAQPRRLVTRRDVFSTYVVLGFAAPALGDRDFAAALVISALVDGAFNGPSATTPPPVLRAVGTIYGYDTAPAHLALWLNGSRIDPSVGLAAIDAVLKGAAAKPLTASVINRFRDTARGQWLLENQSLDERAWSVGNAVAHGLDADAPDGVAAAIARVTPADVQRVAKRYFQRFDVALVLPRAGSGG
jgi:zinc protease